MGILENLITGVLHILCVGVDIVVFFLVVCLLLMRRKTVWLQEFEKAGKPLVETVISYFDKLWHKMAETNLSYKGKLVTLIVVLLVIRLFLVEVFRAV